MTSFQHLLRCCDVTLAVGALIFETFNTHGGIDALGKCDIFIDNLALRVSPFFACLHGHAQNVMRVDAVSHASTRRALQTLFNCERKRLGWLQLRIIVSTSDTVTTGMCMRVAPE